MDAFAELLAIAKAGGAAVAPIFAVLWWLERGERIAAQERNSLMAEKVTVAMCETKTALQTFGTILSGGVRKEP